MDKIIIRRPDDFHVHFRRGKTLQTVVPFTARHFGKAMVMPNTSPPILTAALALDYYEEITKMVREMMMESDSDDHFSFSPFMTIQITDSTTPAMIREAERHNFIIAGKVYPKGVTTNSHNGVSDFEDIYPVFEAMQKAGMVLSIHGQVPESFCLDREKDFHETLEIIAREFPELRIVMEHISTKESVEVVRGLGKNVAATITAHHLVLTLHDVLSWVGDEGNEGLNPHHYCQPIPQTPEDREALAAAAVSGNRKFFFGSDTAPHSREKKESSCGCAGVFSAPVALSVLAKFFTNYKRSHTNPNGAVNAFEPFVSVFGSSFYGLPLNQGEITLIRKPWRVPSEFGDIVPFYAGKLLDWSL